MWLAYCGCRCSRLDESGAVLKCNRTGEPPCAGNMLVLNWPLCAAHSFWEMMLDSKYFHGYPLSGLHLNMLVRHTFRPHLLYTPLPPFLALSACNASRWWKDLLGGERCKLLGTRGDDGALAGTAAPVDSMGMSDSDKGAPWRLGSGVRLVACCSQSLQEYIILLLSEESRKLHPQMAAESSTEIQSKVQEWLLFNRI